MKTDFYRTDECGNRQLATGNSPNTVAGCPFPVAGSEATTTDIYSRIQYRHKLVRLARHAWEAWGEASERHQEAVTALAPCQECITRAVRRCRRAQARYDALEQQLAATTGMSRSAVFNQLSRKWPVVPPLMTLNL